MAIKRAITNSAATEAANENTTSEKKVVKKIVKKAPVQTSENTAEVKKVEKKEVVKKAPSDKAANTKKVGSVIYNKEFNKCFYNKLIRHGFNNLNMKKLNEEMAGLIATAYSETIREVLENNSFSDNITGIHYKRRLIKTRTLNPPRDKSGNKTLMKAHYEIKVREPLSKDEDFIIFGQISDDGNTFISTDGKEYDINDHTPAKIDVHETVLKYIEPEFEPDCDCEKTSKDDEKVTEDVEEVIEEDVTDEDSEVVIEDETDGETDDITDEDSDEVIDETEETTIDETDDESYDYDYFFEEEDDED